MQHDLEASNNKEYEVDSIQNSMVYARKSAIKQLPGLYYLILSKSDFEIQNTSEPTLAIQHLWKLTTIYHKNNLKILIATFFPVNTALAMARPTVKPIVKLTATPKKKCDRLVGLTTTTSRQRSFKSFSYLISPGFFP